MSAAVAPEDINQIPKARFEFKGYPDKGAIGIYALACLGFATVVYFAIKGLFLIKSKVDFSSNLIVVVYICVPTVWLALVCSLCCLSAPSDASYIFKFTMIASVVVNLIFVFIQYFWGSWIISVVVLFLVLLHLAYFWDARGQMALNAALLESFFNITLQYPGLAIVVIGCSLVNFYLLVVGTGSFLLLEESFGDLGLPIVIKYVLQAFLIVFVVWTNQILSHLVFLTTSGLAATYYFSGIPDADGGVDLLIVDPTLRSFYNTITHHAGPNIYGSMFLTISKVLHTILGNSRSLGHGNKLVKFLNFYFSCIFGPIDKILAIYQKHAFVYVAIYGNCVFDAARIGRSNLLARYTTQIIEKCFLGKQTALISFTVGILSSCASSLIYRFATKFEHSTTTFILIGLGGFSAGILQFGIILNFIDAAMITTLVCFGEESEKFTKIQPRLVEEIKKSVPPIAVLTGFNNAVQKVKSRFSRASKVVVEDYQQ